MLRAQLRWRKQQINKGESALTKRKCRITNVSTKIRQNTRSLSLSTTTFIGNAHNVNHDSQSFSLVRVLIISEQEEGMGRRRSGRRRDPRCTVNHKLADNWTATIVFKDVTLAISAAEVTWEHIELKAVGHTPCIDEGLKHRRKNARMIDGSNNLQPLDAEPNKAMVRTKPPREAAVHDLQGMFLPRVLPYKASNQALGMTFVFLEQPGEGRGNVINKIKGFINVGEGGGSFKPVGETGVKSTLYFEVTLATLHFAANPSHRSV